ncbi:MAG TPA: haloacid dehalogenase type II [Candidatus Limnocylindria bacterium]|nr:haloacid dehalogenase type II [Candidatus Limnocylindria bacterium]
MTFDCYGTLIDWENGLSSALRRVIAAHGAPLPPPTDDDALLETYARHEAAAESGPYLAYRAVLAGSLRAVCAERGLRVTEADAEAFAESVREWPPFADSRRALERLAGRFRLAAITNCDDDLFAASSALLGDPFEWAITAQMARSYKPSLNNFELALSVIGVPIEQVVHVAQSLYHDHVPAARIGLRTIWVNRRAGRRGSGATPPLAAESAARPVLVVQDLATFADIALGGAVWRRPGGSHRASGR